MPFEDPWLTSGKRSPIEFERLSYEATGNPIHVWRAYETCSELTRAGVFKGDSLPTWILNYLDAISATVKELFHELRGSDLSASAARAKVVADLGKAFGFVSLGRGARGSAFSDKEFQDRDMFLAIDVRVARREDPERSYEAIFGDVAGMKGVGVDIVERAWGEWRHFLDHRAQG